MLVLTRKLNQSITVGDDVTITVLSVDGDRVSLGVNAPRSIRIFRSELLEGTKEANRASIGSEMASLKAIRAMKKETEPAKSASPAKTGEETKS
jgi:carbon storage regulator